MEHQTWPPQREGGSSDAISVLEQDLCARSIAIQEREYHRGLSGVCFHHETIPLESAWNTHPVCLPRSLDLNQHRWTNLSLDLVMVVSCRFD